MISEQLWDAIVIGAGPAGSVTAFLLAKEQRHVLLVDKAKFPRYKICGCCLNGLSLSLLNQYGLGDIVEKLNAVPLHKFFLKTAINSLQLDLPQSVALSREAFDQGLIAAAISAGVEFISESIATVVPEQEIAQTSRRRVSIKQLDGELLAEGKVIIVADGLSGRSLESLHKFAPSVSRDTRIGAGTVIVAAPDAYEPGTIYMASGNGGYVGLVRLEDGRLDLACAFDLSFVRSSGSPAIAAEAILSEAKFSTSRLNLQNSVWQGTSGLTRIRKLKAAERIFVIGDAASYAEPLTGEGISWALLSAGAVVPIASSAINSWSMSCADEWNQKHAKLIAGRLYTSAGIAKMLRSIELTNFTLNVLKKMPLLSDILLQYLNKPRSASAYGRSIRVPSGKLSELEA